MTPLERDRDRLEAAIAAARYVCCECGSQAVTLDHSAALGWVPVIAHKRVSRWRWCPCTRGGLAEKRASLDLLDALVAVVALAGYGEPVIHRRERVSTP